MRDIFGVTRKCAANSRKAVSCGPRHCLPQVGQRTKLGLNTFIQAGLFIHLLLDLIVTILSFIDQSIDHLKGFGIITKYCLKYTGSLNVGQFSQLCQLPEHVIKTAKTPFAVSKIELYPEFLAGHNFINIPDFLNA